MLLLVIDGEHGSADWVASSLSGLGFRPIKATSPQEALRNGLANRAEAMIVDITGAAPEAAEFVRPLRAAGLWQPLLILSERGHWREKVRSLDSGADDFIVKPARAEEIAARIRAIVRRNAGSAHEMIVAGDLELDLKARIVSLKGEVLDLTRNEFRLLRAFVLRAEDVISHQEIHALLYPTAPERSLNAVEVHIARLRRKIGRSRIRTVRGMGYCIKVNGNSELAQGAFSDSPSSVCDKGPAHSEIVVVQ